jgi:hypothetical protein
LEATIQQKTIRFVCPRTPADIIGRLQELTRDSSLVQATGAAEPGESTSNDYHFRIRHASLSKRYCLDTMQSRQPNSIAKCQNSLAAEFVNQNC